MLNSAHFLSVQQSLTGTCCVPSGQIKRQNFRPPHTAFGSTNIQTHILGEHLCVFLLGIYLGVNPWVKCVHIYSSSRL